jgi:uncharacterized repeat protein (TIGR03833 family)
LRGFFHYFALVKFNDMDGRKRSDVKPGILVNIVEKQNQRTGELTEGIVKQLLTNSPTHPHGIKVRLESGEVGRVKEILEDE